MSSPAVFVSELTKTYDTGVKALKGISLSVEEGDFFALLGPNGAGKTTLIGILTGLINKTSGEARIFGHDMPKDASRAKTYIGLVPQEFNFNIFEKVEDIVVTQAGYYGIPRSEALKNAEPLLIDLGLWEKRNEPSQKLSGGMKRRLMIARALIHKPRLLILDEPTAGVDVELRRAMWIFLRRMNAEGTTVILTTHYLEEAEQLCRTVAIINKGEILINEPMQALLARHGEEKLEDIYLGLIEGDAAKKTL
ncbi:ABC transporter [Candidatus Adlerbacteria bacterium RIFCSPHIGHO2_02_FULL_54_18]|uniref:ABC transporter n=2 Tax=Candidatus Adleribacteriota TaxID=1752736 RepID=A0A1F4Y2M6_9BACT|nr:MAG: ABC transporter [Candidatus Adlerbacteria bacterium RIFCSPLOWO2_01_FULL_54_21b]OGC88225.1 MAG: ABC transporter [Candidatus Adlerbacteria bacterium RIFCSPHIGHO2_02_FULL_54_18]